RVAVKSGITHVIATPHHYDGTYMNLAPVIHSRVNEANILLKEKKINLTILPGMELHLNGDIASDLETVDSTILPLGGKTHYLLIELPYDHVPRYTETLFFDIQLKGFIPIIAHPE